jgi:hypothetical protein
VGLQTRSKWLFLPRRMSKTGYEESQDELKGANTVMLANEQFTSFQSFNVGKLTPTRGFSTAKFVPGSAENIVIAIKSEEVAATMEQHSCACSALLRTRHPRKQQQAHSTHRELLQTLRYLIWLVRCWCRKQPFLAPTSTRALSSFTTRPSLAHGGAVQGGRSLRFQAIHCFRVGSHSQAGQCSTPAALLQQPPCIALERPTVP